MRFNINGKHNYGKNISHKNYRKGTILNPNLYFPLKVLIAFYKPI